MFTSFKDDNFFLHLDQAILGDGCSQQLVGSYFLKKAHDFEDLAQAYKWLFISFKRGNIDAEMDLLEVIARMSTEELVEAKAHVEDWMKWRAQFEPGIKFGQFTQEN